MKVTIAKKLMMYDFLIVFFDANTVQYKVHLWTLF